MKKYKKSFNVRARKFHSLKHKNFSQGGFFKIFLSLGLKVAQVAAYITINSDIYHVTSTITMASTMIPSRDTFVTSTMKFLRNYSVTYAKSDLSLLLTSLMLSPEQKRVLSSA